MSFKNIRGLKYPDEYITKYFFKENLHKKQLNILEFGCANGNNLSLFYQYDHNITGVDFSKESINDANYNFDNIYQSRGSKLFVCEDMVSFAINNKNLNADVFMIPNVISYIGKEDFIKFLELSVKNKLFISGASFFIRTRTKSDYRFGKGKEVSADTFLFDDDITGEKNCLCTHYDEYELVNILKKHLDLKNFKIFNLNNQNLHSNRKILNSDMAIWGQIG
jgi:SAM-dependent methyltransferase